MMYIFTKKHMHLLRLFNTNSIFLATDSLQRSSWLYGFWRTFTSYDS